MLAAGTGSDSLRKLVSMSLSVVGVNFLKDTASEPSSPGCRSHHTDECAVQNVAVRDDLSSTGMRVGSCF